MSKGMSDELRSSYIAALHEAMDEHDDVVRDTLLESLKMSAQGNEELDALFYEVTAPPETEAHFHIQELYSPRNHAANALAPSGFIKNITVAVSEYARQMAGNKNRTSRLLVSALEYGSLDVVFELPPQSLMLGKEQEGIASFGIKDPESVDVKALNRVVDVLSAASQQEESDASLREQLEKMPSKTRRALHNVARTAEHSGWDIHGNVGGHDEQTRPIRLSEPGASRLYHVLRSMPEEAESEELVGYLDGYRRSDGVLYFKNDLDTKKTVQVQVHDVRLIRLVAQYALHEQERFRLHVSKTDKADSLGDVRKVVRVLQSIDPVPSAVQDTLFSAN